MQHIAFRAMGCQMRAVVDTDSPTSAAALACVPHWFARWEQQLSRFRSDSELSVLNRAGYLHAASPVLWRVVQLALAQAQSTDGLVTPTLLDALEAVGYDRSFDTLQPHVSAGLPANGAQVENPDAALLAGEGRPRPQTKRYAWQEISCDPTTRSIHLPAGVRLDLGGSAKGWAADEAVRRLMPYGPALVDAGGDIAVSGPRVDGTPWPIAVADPRTPDQHLDLVLLARGGIATSGRDYRRWQRDGIWYHHLIDPRTLQPATTDVISATVIGRSAADCDVAAKVWLLLGSRAGLRWLEAQPSFAGVVILANGTVVQSSRLTAYRWQATTLEGLVA